MLVELSRCRSTYERKADTSLEEGGRYDGYRLIKGFMRIAYFKGHRLRPRAEKVYAQSTRQSRVSWELCNLHTARRLYYVS